MDVYIIIGVSDACISVPQYSGTGWTWMYVLVYIGNIQMCRDRLGMYHPSPFSPTVQRDKMDIDV